MVSFMLDQYYFIVAMFREDRTEINLTRFPLKRQVAEGERDKLVRS